MKKITKKCLTIFTTALMVSSIGCITVFAAKKNYSFSVRTDENSGVAFSASNPKDDDEQTAYIHTTSGNIINSDIFYMAVYSWPQYDNSNRVSYWKQITSNNGSFTTNYYTNRPAGSPNYLCGDTDKYSVSVEGYWYS